MINCLTRQSLISAVTVSVLGALLAGTTAPLARAATKTPVPCSEISELRDLTDDGDLTLFINESTGDTLNYAVIGDAAASEEVIIFFPGTSSILPDWPTQLLTNATYSPDIVDTAVYKKRQDGDISLCHDYTLVLLDYPGVGDTSFSGSLTGDQIVEDIDAMLDDVAETYGISTDTVNLVGWSLGTLYALKYAMLAPVANPDRTIEDVILIASKAGGKFSGVTAGNQAACVGTMLDTLLDDDLSTKFRIEVETYFSKLTYPFEDQTPYNGTDSGCTATVDTSTEAVTLSVDLKCGARSLCDKNIDPQTLNRATEPWVKTQGVAYDLYLQERYFVNDWNVCHCAAAGSDYTSESCKCARSATIDMSEVNGGVCRTLAAKANRPYALDCAPLDYDGTLAVINAPEDIVIQWRYGRALYRGYREKYGRDKTKYYKFRGRKGAGLAVMMQYPKWVQSKIYTTLGSSD